MKRLLETKDGGPIADRAREVLAQVGPAQASPAAQARIRAAIGGVSASPPRRRPAVLLLAAIVLGVGAAAASAGSFLPWPGTPRTAPVATPAVTGAPVRALDKAKTPPVKDGAPRTGTDTERSPSRDVLVREAAPRKASPSKGPSTAAVSASDVAIVHGAAKALRGDGDPARAEALLKKVSTQGAGPLAEEALALRIEAALARHDPSASGLARDYLARYPQGRYRSLATRALGAKPAE